MGQLVVPCPSDELKAGLLEVAQHGTVFLDELGDMDLQVQAKLLKVLDEKCFRRLGDIGDRLIDITPIASTHQDFRQLVQDKTFCSDLYFRISTIPLFIPPLRERIEDTLIIARSLFKRLGAELGRGEMTLMPDAQSALQGYAWPGNIREMRNVLGRAALLSDKDILERQDLRFYDPTKPEFPLDDADLTLRVLERLHIERVLRAEQGHVENAAIRLGIPRSSLYQKIKRHRIVMPKP